MDLLELETIIASMMAALRLKYKKRYLVKGSSVQYVVEDFGVLVCAINRMDYSQVNDALTKNFPGWRVVYITTNDNMLDKKYEVVWELMRCGYMKWLRIMYPHHTETVLLGQENLGARIISERLRVWANKPRYKFLIEDNKSALTGDLRREYAHDPSFFDYMPEEYKTEG